MKKTEEYGTFVFESIFPEYSPKGHMNETKNIWNKKWNNLYVIHV